MAARADAARVDARRRLAARRRRGSRDPLPRPDPDGQGLPAACRAWTDPSRASVEPSRVRTPTIPPLTLEVWRDRIRRHPGELKNLLRNQAFVAGIGNAYSDEILHAARLLPFRKRSSLAPEEVDALYEATRTTLARRDRRPRGTGAADLRAAGPRLPGGPRQGRASRALAAARGSPKCAPADSSRPTAEAASADGAADRAATARHGSLRLTARPDGPTTASTSAYAVRTPIVEVALLARGVERGPRWRGDSSAVARSRVHSRRGRRWVSRWGLAWPWRRGVADARAARARDSAALGGGELEASGAAPPTADLAITTTRKATTRTATRTAWPVDRLARSPARLHRIDAGRGRRESSARPGAAGRSPDRAASSMPPRPRRTSRTSTWSGVRHSRRCFSAASGAGGVTAAQRWSRAAVAARQEPSDDVRNGHWRRERPETGSPGAEGAGSGGRGSATVMAEQDRSRRGQRERDAADSSAAPAAVRTSGGRPTQGESRAATRGNAKIPATTYFPERLPSQYLRRWRA